jgi:hypothetical protein
MTTIITGKDATSLRVLASLSKGTRVSEIAEMYSISLDQAKRLSRYNRILQDAAEQLSLDDYERVTLLGIKILPLAKLFKRKDWEAISEILSVVTDETTRDELSLLVKGLEDKRDWLRNLKEDSSIQIQQLRELEADLIQKDKRLKSSGKREESASIRKRIKEVHNEIKLIDSIMKQEYNKSINITKLSLDELKEHKELQRKASSWLYKRGYVVTTDWVLPNGVKTALAAYDEYGKVVIVEIIVSRFQISNIRVWDSYLNCCDELLLLPSTNELYADVFDNAEYNRFGLLQDTEGISVVRNDSLKHLIPNRNELLHGIARTLSKGR